MHFSLSNCPLFEAQFQLLLLHFLTERILCWLEFTTLKWPHVGEYSTKAEHSLEKKSVFFTCGAENVYFGDERARLLPRNFISCVCLYTHSFRRFFTNGFSSEVAMKQIWVCWELFELPQSLTWGKKISILWGHMRWVNTI